jgi:heat shock protein HtpX
MNRLKTFLLLGAISALLLAAGATMGRGWLLGASVLSILMNLGAYFWSHKLVLRMQQARELAPGEVPELYADVAELSSKAGLPMPRVYLIPDDAPNAFATGRDPEHGVVAFTEGILRIMPRRELRGVIAHELSHIRHRDILVATVAAGLAGAITLLANIFQWTSLFGLGGGSDEEGPSPLVALAFALLAPIGAGLIQMAISRSREFMADEGAARLTGDPEGLARALERLARGNEIFEPGLTAQPASASLMTASPFSGDGLMSWFSTHPPIAMRTSRLRAMSLHPARVA